MSLEVKNLDDSNFQRIKYPTSYFKMVLNIKCKMIDLHVQADQGPIARNKLTTEKVY